jgi:hypothetical protein
MGNKVLRGRRRVYPSASSFVLHDFDFGGGEGACMPKPQRRQVKAA